MKNYKELGLTALARTAELSENAWFKGHFGAAILAGAFLLENESLQEASKPFLIQKLDKLIAENGEFFVPYESSKTVPLMGLLEKLEQNCSKLSRSGHGVIYGTLALRAIQDLPDMATTPVIAGIAKLLEFTQVDNPKRYYSVADYNQYRAETVEIDLNTAVQNAYRLSCQKIFPDQSIDGQYHFFIGEKIHGITHAQALHNLSLMGHANLIEKGLVNLSAQLELNEKHPTTLIEVEGGAFNPYEPNFWERDFADPHIIKLAYSATELNRHLGDTVIPLENLDKQWAALH